MSTIGDTFRKGIALLHAVANPVVESKILLITATGLSDVEILGSPGRKISAAQEKRFFRLVGKRLAGSPLAHLTGKKEFWSLPFRIVPGVLIPRPETELIVETVLSISPDPEVTIVDIGTGSGNIAVALTKELPRARIIATDISVKALAVAAHNARQNSVDNITFKRGSLFSPLRQLKLEGRCGFIVSNPPYVSAGDWAILPAEVRDHEPKRALLGGESGLEFIGRLVRGSLTYLKPGGALVFEIGHGQAKAALALFDRRWTAIGVSPDLRGIPRVIKAVKA
ncbi:MAG: protein-(glutamine-N5) methyltransferase, release factor-specific [Candidatus Aminicenantes bacterium RBG_16_63_16]|nr:MAG: protein-(glutamine-N5) methyltransferase, release factor-specific [Candidatus Aminicenantes bacterium RBG_16_63_16]